ncbi:uncharacterized mitochondrial protein AtMg00810-like [Tripterygium wilfordii]|uniref:uncharacterized mitochondrial protein AtMg00810-like n=1 Tax=Tripterygium wilfordii TaxID=458696 RepID=UPI0018F84F6E|nr:uncharacterized mitochondrial protein AtMg00810-like [Tripterygium wilfordii]
MAIGGDDYDLIQSVKDYLSKCFKIKELGKLKYFLDIEVHKSSVGYFINKKKYTLDLLQETGYINCKPVYTLVDANVKLSFETGTRLENPLEFRRLIGKLMYLTITRLDLNFSVNTLAQFMQNPTNVHLSAGYRILRYIKGTVGEGLFYPSKTNMQVEAYCDADWAACIDTRRSVTGYCIKLGNSLIAWKSKKHKTVFRSSVEAEYHSMAAAVSELQWIYHLFQEIQIEIELPMVLHCDSQATIHIANNPVFHERTKHIDIDCHFTREKIQQGLISLSYVKSEKQPADVLTKVNISESFQVATIIEKLPPRSIDFKNYLKHKRKEMYIEDLIVRLKIEEENRKNTMLPRMPKIHVLQFSKLKNDEKKKERTTSQVSGQLLHMQETWT